MSYDARIVACARGWIGTRFHHQGRLKKTATHKGGVDCLGLLAGVAQELELTRADGKKLSSLDERDYSHYPDTNRLRARLAEALQAIAIEEMRPGDVALLCVENNPQHMGIVSDGKNGLGLIHAYAPARAVVEHALDDYWRARIEAAYRFCHS